MATGEALFANSTTVWVTNGTKAGTHQLLLRADPGQQLEGVIATPFPNYFHVFGNELLFFELEAGVTGSHVQIYTARGGTASKRLTLSGTAASFLQSGDFAQFGTKLLIVEDVTSVQGKPPKVEFVVTDLTTHGTKTFTINGPPLPFTFNPSEFTGLANRVVFSATNNRGVNTLWSSDGTAKGTTALSVRGAASTGLFASDLTAFGKEILFNGADSAGDRGLWVTDGTAKGTRELVQTGAPFGTAESLNPQQLTAAGTKLFFAADGGLWVTTGTAKGTKEIAVPGAADNGLEVNPQEMIRFGSRVLFVGATASFGTDIFVSDGTTKGSYPLVWLGTFPQGFTVFGNHVLFKAEDSTQHEGLWITDGSKHGTQEIKVPNAYSLGVLDLVNFAGAAIGKEFLFVGTDRLQNTGLWVTNGTTNGTREIFSPLSVTDLTAVPAATASHLLADTGEILIAGHHAKLAGTKGADLFEFATPGSRLHPDGNVVLHFDAATDKIAFSDPGFRLDLPNPGAAPQALPADLFTANATGGFTNRAERFAYDTATGQLFYDAHGDKPGSSRELVATFAHHPHIGASDVFFVS